MTPEELHAELRRRTSNPHVIERIMRLNPEGVREGAVPRGWRDGDRRRRDMVYSASIPRGRVIRKHGRERWEGLPAEHIVRRGRRQWVTFAGWFCGAPQT